MGCQYCSKDTSFTKGQLLFVYLEAYFVGFHFLSLFPSKNFSSFFCILAWKAAPLCLFWTIWREKIRRVFYNFAKVGQAVKHSFMYNFLEWLKAWWLFFCVPLALFWPFGAFCTSRMLLCTLLLGVVSIIDLYLLK